MELLSIDALNYEMILIELFPIFANCGMNFLYHDNAPINWFACANDFGSGNGVWCNNMAKIFDCLFCDFALAWS
jgi:hypothetical protein